MRRFLRILTAALLLLCLTACAHSVNGSYKLSYITFDGLRVSPSGYGLNISFELTEDGVGSASYSGTTVDISWVEDGDEILVTGPMGELRFARDGEKLVLHDEGTMLFFVPEPTED